MIADVQIAILLFDGLTALDAIGPYEALNRLPDATTTFVAEQPGPKRTEDASLALIADAALANVPAPDIVLVPGGKGRRALMDDGPVHEWLRTVHETSTWTTSVCTGSLILAASGLLSGRRATTHWLAMEELGELGAEPVCERVVFDGKLVTAAGVSAGIDMGLALAARIAGERVAEAIQLGIEYDPSPPFGAGSPRTARPDLVQALRANSKRLT
jgi:putative intracellular protease/amidase